MKKINLITAVGSILPVAFSIISCGTKTKIVDVSEKKNSLEIANELRKYRNPISILMIDHKNGQNIIIPKVEKQYATQLKKIDSPLIKGAINFKNIEKVSDIKTKFDQEKKLIFSKYQKITDRKGLVMLFEYHRNSDNLLEKLEYEIVKNEVGPVLENFADDLKTVFGKDKKYWEEYIRANSYGATEEEKKIIEETSERRIIDTRDRLEPEIGTSMPFEMGLASELDWSLKYANKNKGDGLKPRGEFERIYNKYNTNYIKKAQGQNGANKYEVRFKYNIIGEPFFNMKTGKTELLLEIYENGTMNGKQAGFDKEKLHIKNFTNVHYSIIEGHHFKYNGTNEAENIKVKDVTLSPQNSLKKVIKDIDFFWRNISGSYQESLSRIKTISIISSQLEQLFDPAFIFAKQMSYQEKNYDIIKIALKGVKDDNNPLNNKKGINQRIKEYNSKIKDPIKHIKTIQMPKNFLDTLLDDNQDNLLNHWVKKIVDSPMVDFNWFIKKINDLKIRDINDPSKINEKYFSIDKIIGGNNYCITNMVFVNIFLSIFVDEMGVKINEIATKTLNETKIKISEIEKQLKLANQ